MAPPPPLHPSLPARPLPAGAPPPPPSSGPPHYSYQPGRVPSSSSGAPALSAPPAGRAAPGSREGTPLSLPSRPAFLSHNSTSGSPRAQPHSGAGGLNYGSPALGASLGASGSGSPKPAGAAAAGAAGADDPWSTVRPRIATDEVRPSAALVELGEGWRVRWRAWKAPALLVHRSDASSLRPDEDGDAAPAPDALAYDPFAAPPGASSPFPAPAPAPASSKPAPSTLASSTSSSSTAAAAPPATAAPDPAPPAAKKQKKAPAPAAGTGAGGKPTAFDEMLAEEAGEAAPAKKKGRVPKAVREAQAAAAAAASPVPDPPPPLQAPMQVDLLSPSLGASISASGSASRPGSIPPVLSSTAPPAASVLADAPIQPVASTSASSSSSSSSSFSAAALVRNRLAPLLPAFSAPPLSSSAADHAERAPDPLLAAQRLIRARAAELNSAGGADERDGLGLISWVRVGAVRLENGKGKERAEPPEPANEAEAAKDKKGKRKEVDPDADDDDAEKQGQDDEWEGEGRVLWVFQVERGGEGEGEGEGGGGESQKEKDERVLDDVQFEGLEDLANGTFTHSTLFPALYPSSSPSPSSTASPAYSSPLSHSARSYPSCLALSSTLLTVPSLANRFPPLTPPQGAYAAFRAAVREVVLDSMAASSSAPSSSSEGPRVRLDAGVVYLPPPPPLSSAHVPRPASSTPPATKVDLVLPSLNRTALVLQPRVAEVPFTALLAPGHVRRGTPVVLAPSGAKARFVRPLVGLSEEQVEHLRAEWGERLAAPLPASEEWVLCALDLAPPSSSSSATSASARASKPVDVVWPRLLCVVDGRAERLPARSKSASSSSPSRSRSRSPRSARPANVDAETAADASDSDDDPATSADSSPEQRDGRTLSGQAAPFSPPRWVRPNAALRRRLASAALGAAAGSLSLSPRASAAAKERRRSSATSLGTVGEGDGEAMAVEEEEGTFRDPVRRRTGEVWRWMGEEVRRREREVEEREREREREKERAVEGAKAEDKGPPLKLDKHDDDAKRECPPPPPPASSSSAAHGAHAAAAAAAPINMRTPMSLGTASTEAPSPAELFSSLASGTSVGAAHLATGSSAAFMPSSAPPALGPAAQPMDLDHFDLGGMYPSPAEPLSFLPSSAAPGAGGSTSSSAPISTLDAAFQAYDWGDTNFGASTGASAGGHGGHGAGEVGPAGAEVDDSMLLNLTDDDFSFFDTPATPLPPSTLGSNVSMSLAMSMPPLHDDPSALFDPFSVAASSMPQVGGSAVPHALLASPPAGEHFSFAAFDAAHVPNALGLSASTSSDAPSISASAPAASSPLAILQPAPNLQLFSPTLPSSFPSAHPPHPPTPRFSPSVSLSALHLSSSPSSLPSAFEPITFEATHAALDGRYDPRKGKFGLPSPDSDAERSARSPAPALGLSMLERLSAAVGRRRSAKGASGSPEKRIGGGSWFEAVCDPRVAVAERLRTARLAQKEKSLVSGSATGGKASSALAQPRAWVRHKVLALPSAGLDDPETAQNSADEMSEEESSSGDEGGRGASGFASRDEVDGEDGAKRAASLALQRRLDKTLGAALLALGSTLPAVLARALAPLDTGMRRDGEDKPALPIVDSAKEITLATVAEQAMYNSEFRDATLALCMSDRGSATVSPQAIELAVSALSSSCSSLSPLSLFADHTALPPLVEQTPTSFLLRTQQCVMQTSAAAVEFWRPMGFEPLAGGKDVTAFAVYEDNGPDMHDAARAWLKSIGGVYQGLRLGEHSLGSIAATTNFSGVQDGLIPLPPGLLTDTSRREELKLFYSTLIDHAKTTQSTVVYLISDLVDSPLSPSTPLAGIIHQIGKSRSNIVNMHPCPISIATVTSTRHASTQPGHVDRLVRLAFSIYDQLQLAVARLRIPMPETFPSARQAPNHALGPAVRLHQAPAITVAPAKRRPVQFALNWPASTLEVEHRHRFFHVCYGNKRVKNGDSSQEWLAVTMMDEKGEMWRNIPRFIKIPAGVVPDVHRVRVVWSFAKALIDLADLEYRVILCKVGEPTAVEAKAWDSLLKEHLAASKRPLHVTLTCVDLDPAFSLATASAPPPSSRRPSATTPIPEDGELPVAISRTPSGTGKVALFDAQPAHFSFTPAEPISLVFLPIVAPASVFLTHVPRITSLAYTAPEPFQSDPDGAAPASTYALHFLLTHVTRSSSYTGTLAELVADVRQNYGELAALGQARWGTSGRLSWHIEAACQALALAEYM